MIMIYIDVILENTAETGQASQSSVRDDTQYHDADLANDDLLDTFSCTSGQWWSVKLVEATGHDPVLVRAVYITQVAERYRKFMLFTAI